ncbi:MAG: glycosyltransferase family 87 protein [Candidatus Riflebacteria bacterium]|nr:glycosyltransferase family 87 protein [Candidatus Riflebacteria bacterium]
MNQIKPNKFFYIKTAFLTFLLIVLALALLNLYPGGLRKMVASTDKSAVLYEDFIGYYYPASIGIFTDNPILEGFFYTPTCALLISCLTTSDIQESLQYWHAFQLLTLFLLIFVPAIYLAKKTQKMSAYYLYIAMIMLSFPVYHNLNWGQISIFITFCAFYSVFLFEKKHEWLSALFLTVAILCKYYAAIVLIYYLAKKQYRYLTKVLVILIVLGLILPIYILGFDKTILIFKAVFDEISYASDWVTYSINSHYLPNTIIRLTGIEASGAARGILSILSLSICFAFFYKYFKQKKDNDFCPVRAAATFLLIPLFFNTSWPHYFVYLPFLIVATFFKTDSKIAKTTLFIVAILQTPLIFAAKNYVFYGFYAFLLWANLLILLLHFNDKTVQS